MTTGAVPKTGYVYFIDSADGFVKIGYSWTPMRRLAAHQVSNPHILSMRGWFAAEQSMEGYIHSILKKVRVTGEWFKSSPEVDGVFKEMSKSYAAFLDNAKRAMRPPTPTLPPRPTKEFTIEDFVRNASIDQARKTYNLLNALDEVYLFHDRKGCGRRHLRCLHESTAYVRAMADHYAENARIFPRRTATNGERPVSSLMIDDVGSVTAGFVGWNGREDSAQLDHEAEMNQLLYGLDAGVQDDEPAFPVGEGEGKARAVTFFDEDKKEEAMIDFARDVAREMRTACSDLCEDAAAEALTEHAKDVLRCIAARIRSHRFKR